MNSLKLGIKRNPTYGKCPSCEVINTLRRSRARKWNEIIIKKVPIINIYTCRKCGWRGYMPTIRFTKHVMKQMIYYAVVLVFSAYVFIEFLKWFLGK
jgi:predicted RNA-binding Zn-ribbon protein involved in translation (DUF1610 family)